MLLYDKFIYTINEKNSSEFNKTYNTNEGKISCVTKILMGLSSLNTQQSIENILFIQNDTIFNTEHCVIHLFHIANDNHNYETMKALISCAKNVEKLKNEKIYQNYIKYKIKNF
jgi:hypothetical protein